MAIFTRYAPGAGLGGEALEQAALEGLSPAAECGARVLLIPPDITRIHSRAGLLTSALYEAYTRRGAHVDVMPALGSHLPMDAAERAHMFGDIPAERFLAHNWREGVVTLGAVPGAFVRDVSDGLLDYSIEVQLASAVVNGGYNRIIAIGQVVPHEVAGMSSYSKHIFVGCGGSEMINRTHFLGAVVGAERIMGRADNPVRAVLDYAQREYLGALPITYVMTVVGPEAAPGAVNGLFIGDEREAFERAAALSAELNINRIKPVTKAVVYLDPEEYRSTWVGNKAVYRTRMALQDGAHLLVLAPGVRMYGEDPLNDALIAKYGYNGRDYTLDAVKKHDDLGQNLSVAAHLIHGSSDGRFLVTYAVKAMPAEAARRVGFGGALYDEAVRRYDPARLRDGYNTMDDGEEIFYISNPGLGLWSSQDAGDRGA